MAEASWGLIAAVVGYALGTVLWVQIARASWARTEASDPDLATARDETFAWRATSMLRRPSKESIAWFLAATVIAALLRLADFSLGFLVLYVAALAAWWASETIKAHQEETDEWIKRGKIDTALSASRKRLLLAGFYGSGWMIAAGALGAACFAAVLIVDVMR